MRKRGINRNLGKHKFELNYCSFFPPAFYQHSLVAKEAQGDREKGSDLLNRPPQLQIGEN